MQEYIENGQTSDGVSVAPGTSHSAGAQHPLAPFDFTPYHPTFPSDLWHFLNHLMACLSAQAFHQGAFIPGLLFDSATASSQEGDGHSANEIEGAEVLNQNDNQIGQWHLPQMLTEGRPLKNTQWIRLTLKTPNLSMLRTR